MPLCHRIFEGAAAFDGDTLESAGSGDIFLCKYAPDGTLMWSHRAGGSNLDRVMDVEVDPFGNIYLTGGFNGNVGFGTDSLFSSDRDVFIAKYDSLGDVQWVRAAGGNSSDFGESVAADASGNVYVVGTFFSDSLRIGSTVLYSGGTSDLFFAKYDPSGNLLWARSGGATGIASGTAIDTDLFGNIYLTGSFQDTLNFRTSQLVSRNGQDIYLLKCNPGGTVQWAKVISGNGVDVSQNLLAGIEHYFYITGAFTQDIHFDNTQLNSNGDFDIYLAKYDTNGNLVWVEQAGASGPDKGWGLAKDDHNNIYLSGGFRDALSVGNFVLNSLGNTDIFVIKYDVSGKVLWAGSAGSTDGDLSYDVAFSHGGHVFATGNFTSMASFDTTLLTSSGREDMFLAKIVDFDSTHIPNDPFNEISGAVFHDPNSDCLLNGSDIGLNPWILKAEPGDWYTSTGSGGNFSLGDRFRYLYPVTNCAQGPHLSDWLFVSLGRAGPSNYL